MDINDLLPHVLKKRVIARIEHETLYIHNRKEYPFKDEYVACNSVEGIAHALSSMVTQGGGVLQVVLTSMLFIARHMEQHRIVCSIEALLENITIITDARKTNTTAKRVVDRIIMNLHKDVDNLSPTTIYEKIERLVVSIEDEFDALYDAMSDIGSELIEDGDGIFTTCFAEHTFLLSLKKAQLSGKKIHAWVPETRPYLQGAHLTAPSLVEMGIKTTLMSDAMAAHYIQEGKITRYMSALDTLTLDGCAVNKVGTLNNAILCKYYHIPFHLFAISPDKEKMSCEDIIMEERDPIELLKFQHNNITSTGVNGIYPAFDIIPSHLITGIITPKGLCRPDEIATKFLTKQEI
jgi:methylthioribose-1-phosphate isomerase